MTNKEIARMWLTHSDHDSIDNLKNLMHPNHKFYNNLTPHPLGVEEHFGMLHKMANTFSNQVHHIDLLLEDGNYIAVRGRLNAIHSGEFRGIEATNKPIEVSFNLIMQILDGQIADEFMELNPMSIIAQVSGNK
jgi:predicted ester cyclase